MKVVIAGAGEVGFHIAGHLVRENKEVVIIDTDPEALRRVSENTDVQTILGSGSSPAILEAAGIRDAEILLAVTNQDETNLVACLMADTISPGTKKLARIRDGDFDPYHEALRKNAPHIDTVINPEVEVVRFIERLMSLPGAVDVGEFADGRVRSVGIRLNDRTPLTGVRLLDLPDRVAGPRPLIFAIIRDEKLIIPGGKDRLMSGDVVYFMCEEKRLGQIMALFDKPTEPARRILIVGGGSIGLRLAHEIEKRNVQVKLIERNAQRCDLLAKELQKTIILCGDGSDQDILREENIQDIDMVVTLTEDEETNILTSLLAKRLGARKTITKISKFSYFPLMLTIGIEQVVDPRLAAINSILQHIRRGKVLSAVSIRGEEAELLEAVAMETSDIVGVPLQKIRFPKNVIVATIIRGDEIITPRGDSVVEPGDRIVIFAHRDAIPKIERILSVKLEYF